MDNSVLNLKSSASLGIVLDLFKNEHITQNEAIQLIEDLYNRSSSPYYPQNTWDLEEWQGPFKVTYT